MLAAADLAAAMHALGVTSVSAGPVWLGTTLLHEDGVEPRVGRAGRILHITPEFDDAAALAVAQRVPVRQVLDKAAAAADAGSSQASPCRLTERASGQPGAAICAEA